MSVNFEEIGQRIDSLNGSLDKLKLLVQPGADFDALRSEFHLLMGSCEDVQKDAKLAIEGLVTANALSRSASRKVYWQTRYKEKKIKMFL